jgi:hypothetical protein
MTDYFVDDEPRKVPKEVFAAVCLYCHSTPLKELRKFYVVRTVKVKGKAIPLQAWRGTEGSWRLRLTDFLRQSAHEGGKVVSPTQRPPLPPQ